MKTEEEGWLGWFISIYYSHIGKSHPQISSDDNRVLVGISVMCN